MGNPFLLLKTEQHMVKKYGETGRCWTEYLKFCLQHGTLDVSIEPEKNKQQKCLARLRQLVCTPLKGASKSSNLTQNPQLQPPKHKQCTEMSASVPSGAARLPENTPYLRTPTQRVMPTTEHTAIKMPSANSGNRALYSAYHGVGCRTYPLSAVYFFFAHAGKVWVCAILVIKWRVNGKRPLESARESLLNQFDFFENTML